MTQIAKNGDTVLVHYTGTLTADGTQFDSSRDREPLQFTLGENMVIPGFDKAVLDLPLGGKTKVDIPFMEAYGPVIEEMIVNVERSGLPEGMEPEIGMELQLRDENGQGIPVVITEVDETTITLDANHHLAGKDLTFEIELVTIL